MRCGWVRVVWGMGGLRCVCVEVCGCVGVYGMRVLRCVEVWVC